MDDVAWGLDDGTLASAFNIVDSTLMSMTGSSKHVAVPCPDDTRGWRDDAAHGASGTLPITATPTGSGNGIQPASCLSHIDGLSSLLNSGESADEGSVSGGGHAKKRNLVSCVVD